MEGIENYHLRQLSRAVEEGNSSRLRDLGSDSDCFRVYDRMLRSFDLAVDRYADHALVTLFSPCKGLPDSQLRECIGSALRIPAANVVIRSRIRRADAAGSDGSENSDGRLEDGEWDDGGEGKSLPLQVRESGIVFNVDLLKRMDSGIFLENQRSRLLVKSLSEGKRVLNLFCYTGGYSLFAFAGGATSCVSVDMSQSALEACKANMESNGFVSDEFKLTRMDSMEFVENYIGKPFDLIIADCPAFSNRHGTRERSFNVQRDHARLLNGCRRIMDKEGVAIFRTSLSNFVLDRRKLEDFSISAYTSEMVPGGFGKGFAASKTFALSLKHDGKESRMGKRRKDFDLDYEDIAGFSGLDKFRSGRQGGEGDARPSRDRIGKNAAERRQGRFGNGGRNGRSDRYGRSDRFDRSEGFERSARDERRDRFGKSREGMRFGRKDGRPRPFEERAMTSGEARRLSEKIDAMYAFWEKQSGRDDHDRLDGGKPHGARGEGARKPWQGRDGRRDARPSGGYDMAKGGYGRAKDGFGKAKDGFGKAKDGFGKAKSGGKGGYGEGARKPWQGRDGRRDARPSGGYDRAKGGYGRDGHGRAFDGKRRKED